MRQRCSRRSGLSKVFPPVVLGVSVVPFLVLVLVRFKSWPALILALPFAVLLTPHFWSNWWLGVSTTDDARGFSFAAIPNIVVEAFWSKESGCQEMK